MNAFYLDPSISEEDRRQLLYDGQLVVLSPAKGPIKLAEHAYQMLEDVFGGLDPETAQTTSRSKRTRRFSLTLNPASFTTMSPSA